MFWCFRREVDIKPAAKFLGENKEMGTAVGLFAFRVFASLGTVQFGMVGVTFTANLNHYNLSRRFPPARHSQLASEQLDCPQISAPDGNFLSGYLIVAVRFGFP